MYMIIILSWPPGRSFLGHLQHVKFPQVDATSQASDTQG
jgi:hypothetical protein